MQVAALRPPQLKAIITIASTDDRYADDVHYMVRLVSTLTTWLCCHLDDSYALTLELLPLHGGAHAHTCPYMHIHAHTCICMHIHAHTEPLIMVGKVFCCAGQRRSDASHDHRR
jgi:hypothetical protein